MGRWEFSKGLHDLGKGCYAYLQPDGSWGFSNAGLIVDGKDTLLVDTLFDLPLTREMLDVMRRKVPAAANIDTLVNTHANGDHTFGNQLVGGARIVASRSCAEEMAARKPDEFRQRMDTWRDLGRAGAFLHGVMGSKFDFNGVVYTPPTEVFDDRMKLHVGSKEVELITVGPAHTRGDILIHVPADRTVFAGDALFVDGHPVVWAGPFSNWIKACDLMLSWDVETIVPGHGPITDKGGIRALKFYLEYVYAESRKRYDAGMGDIEAARDISLEPFDGWLDAERIIINVHSAYREFTQATEPIDTLRLFDAMAEWRAGEAIPVKCGACESGTHVHGA
jgi:glyoxylase-like metal-dependent hydrolase (beta-lactamase superfamily II)